MKRHKKCPPYSFDSFNAMEGTLLRFIVFVVPIYTMA
jgi:hypothetical protein